MGYVGEVKIGNDTHLVGSTLYGTCGSAANAAEKSVTCANFSNLMNNITIHVKFTNTNTATNPTLNVNETGAKRIYRYGTTAPGNSTITSWNAGSVVSFTYDGSSWMMNDAFDGQQLKTDLQNSFQAGVDSVYDAVVAEGSTPASKSLSDVVAGIHAIPNKNTETFPATTREAAKDMGYNNKYRYVNTTGVPNSCTATYPNAFTTNGQKDLGATHNYRYINVNVPNPSSGIINITANGNYDVTSKATAAVAVPASAVVSGTINITTNGTTDVTTYKNANVQVPASAVVSGTYTYPAGSTGGTVDVTNYKNANAENVYAKGKADGITSVNGITGITNLARTQSAYTKVYSYVFSSAGTLHICYGHGEATNDYGNGLGILDCYLGSSKIMNLRIDSNTATDSTNINGSSPYDKEYSVSAGTELALYKQEDYIDGQSGGTLRGSIAILGYFKPNA